MERSPEKEASVEMWRETIRKYITRETLHRTVGTYHSDDEVNESKN